MQYKLCIASTIPLLIFHLGAGYDQIDVHACTARTPVIRVSNVPTAVDDATADVNMFLIIGALRNFNSSMMALREGKWRGQPLPSLGHDPEGKVLGILGMGGIGRNLKRKAEAFGMKIIYHNRKKLSDELADGAEYMSFDELLQKSDIISLNLPLNVRLLFFLTPTSCCTCQIVPACLHINFTHFFRQKHHHHHH